MSGARPAPAEVAALAERVGIDAVGFAPAGPFTATRRHIEERRREGLHGGMQFTYRNPARSTDPSRALPGARALVVGARSYRRADPAAPGTGAAGVVARYSWADRYEPLRRALEEVAGLLREHGWQARVLVDDNALVDRAAAHRAGIGWFGKNTLLLLPGLGSWFVLGSVVTDAPLAPDPVEEVPDGCGSCTRCITACPTGAIVAPGVLDARRCLAWLLEAPGSFPVEHRPALGGRIYGCDDCQLACPVNRRADRSDPPPSPAPEEEPYVDLVDLLEAPDDELMRRFGRWYVPRRQPRYLRRNALVALGNVGQGRDRRTERVLAACLADREPVVREHAAWAAHRLGRSDLVDARAGGLAGVPAGGAPDGPAPG